MFLNKVLADIIEDREGIKVTFSNDKPLEKQSFAEMMTISKHTHAYVAEIFGYQLYASQYKIEDFDEHFIPDLLRRDVGSAGFDDELLREYAEYKIIPARRKTDSKRVVFCLDPTVEILAGFSEYDKILAPKGLFNTVYADMDSFATKKDDETIREFISRLLKTAQEYDATDTDISSFPSSLKCRFQILGDWTEFLIQIPIIYRKKLISSLGAMAMPPVDYIEGKELKFKIETDFNGISVSWRVGVMPTLLGEAITIRKLPGIGKIPNFKDLGFGEKGILFLNHVISLINAEQKGGLALVTGATGSGKSLTQYSVQHEYVLLGKKVHTIEDPVEVVVPGANQTIVMDDGSIDERFQFTHYDIMKAMLRQKFDVGFFGEIRGPKEMNVAVEAALTGHFIWGTLHSGSVSSTLKRLVKLGLDMTMVSDTLTIIISQELKKILCPACSTETWVGSRRTVSRTGCTVCSNRGYTGRTVVYEMAIFDSVAREKLTEELFTKNMDAAIKDIIVYLTSKGLYLSMEERLEDLKESGKIESLKMDFFSV